MKASSDLLLLDVNVLVALAWPDHQFHESAIRRLEDTGVRWATCATTQLGFIRLSANPAARPNCVTPAVAAALLANMLDDPFHVYLESSPEPAEVASAFAEIRGHKKVTDAYLVKVAQKHGARFLTFDAKLRDMGGVEVLL